MLPLSLLITAVLGASKSNSVEINEWLEKSVVAPDQIRAEISEYIQQLIPSFNVPDRTTWEHQASALRQEILDKVVFRGVPQEWIDWKAETMWEDTLKVGPGYQIRKLRYQALPGLWIPALLSMDMLVHPASPLTTNSYGVLTWQKKAS